MLALRLAKTKIRVINQAEPHSRSSSPWRSIVFALLLLFGSNQASHAQAVRFSEDPNQFIVELKKAMEGTKVPAYVQAASGLEAVWNSSLNGTQQQLLINVFKNLAKKGHRPGPLYQTVLSTLSSIISQQGDINGYLIMTDHSIEKYDAKSLQKMLVTALLIVEKKQLYQSNYSRMYLASGQYRFRFDSTTPAQVAALQAANDGWDVPVNSTNDSVQIKIAKVQPLPTVTGAVIDLENASFSLATAHDSVSFGPSSGSISLVEGLFVGKNGKFNWPVDDIVTEFDAYSFNIASAKIAADNAKITDKRLSKPILGSFIFESVKKAPGSYPFPKFVSNTNDAVFGDLRKSMKFKGGYTRIGKDIYSTSRNGGLSELEVSFQSKPVLRTRSTQFLLRDSVVSANLASIYIPLGKDSITHSGVSFYYNDDEGLVRLANVMKSDYAKVPYQDSYHKMSILSEAARWYFSKEQIDFYTISGKTVANVRLESADYFKKERYQSMADQFGFQPLSVAATYIQATKKQTFFAEELAKRSRQDTKIMKRALDILSLEGYFAYDKNTDEYAVTSKGARYILANFDKVDYDNFMIESSFPSNEKLTNVSISTKDTLMTIRGVSRFIISDSLQINAIPADRKILMGRNRNFTLNGLLQSSNYKFTGGGLKFDYDKFFVNLNQVDSITYIPRDNFAKGGKGEVGGSVKYEKGGTFYFNDAKNKSGKQKGATGSPRIVMPDGLTVFFDQAERGDLKYPKEVSFKIPKLDYGGLDKRDVEFAGTFNSGGIFVPLKTILRSMPDNSLGFNYQAGVEPLKIYGGKASVKLSDTLSMDNNGLQSAGLLSYLAANLTAKKILFTTDSLTAEGSQASIREIQLGKGYFPKVDIKDYTLTWKPAADSMMINSGGSAISFYNGSTQLEGSLLLRTSGLYGDGTIKRTDAELLSKDIKFGKEGFLAQNAVVSIGDMKAKTEPLLRGNYVNVDFNIVKGITDISTQNNGFAADSSQLVLPNVSYRTSISKAQWNVKNKTISMKGDVKNSSFTSTSPDQESLSFNAAEALYDIGKNSLSLSGVPFIKTADVKIIPNKGQVGIEKNGHIQALTQARIEIDTLNVNHKMKNANIRILSRNRFEGSATYQYTTATKDTFNIKMENFELHEIDNSPTATAKRTKTKITAATPDSLVRYYTTARAEIKEQDHFFLAPGIGFRGDVNLTSYEPSLALDGFLRAQLKPRPNLTGSWIPYKGKPGDNVSISIDKNLKNEVEEPLFAGLHFKSMGGIYPTFLSPKDSDSDEDIFRGEGSMKYDSTGSFRIIPPAGSDGLVNEQMGLTLNDKKSLMSYAGKLNFTPNPWLQASGFAEAQIDSNRYEFDAMMVMKLPSLTPVAADLAKKIVQINLDQQNSDPAEDDTERLRIKLAGLLGQKMADDHLAKSAAGYKPLFQASPILDAQILLSDVHLKWSEKNSALYSTGPIGIGNLGQNDVNAKVYGFYEFRRADTGDEFGLYLELSNDTWYYIDFAQKQLGVITSDPELNDMVLARGKNAKTKDMELIQLGMEDKVAFVSRFTDNYKPIKRNAKKPAPAAVQKKGTTKKPTAKPDAKSEGF